MSPLEKGSTDTIEFYWQEKNILRITICQGAEMDLEHSMKNSVALADFTGNRTYYQLVDARADYTITPEGRDYAAKEEVRSKVAARAVLISSLAARLVTNFYSKSNPEERIKTFDNEESALQWLRELKVKDNL
jgi:hypothetical protein